MLIKVQNIKHLSLIQLINRAQKAYPVRRASFTEYMTVALAAALLQKDKEEFIYQLIHDDSLFAMHVPHIKEIFVHPDRLRKLAAMKGREQSRREEKKIEKQFNLQILKVAGQRSV